MVITLSTFPSSHFSIGGTFPLLSPSSSLSLLCSLSFPICHLRVFPNSWRLLIFTPSISFSHSPATSTWPPSHSLLLPSYIVMYFVLCIFLTALHKGDHPRYCKMCFFFFRYFHMYSSDSLHFPPPPPPPPHLAPQFFPPEDEQVADRVRCTRGIISSNQKCPHCASMQSIHFDAILWAVGWNQPAVSIALYSELYFGDRMHL